MPTAPHINTRPTALILSVLALLLVVPLLAYSVIRLEGPRIQQEALADLTAIGLLKANQIEAWLTERRGDAEVLMASEGFIDSVERSLDRHDPLTEARIARRVAALGRAYGYHRVELLDAHSRPDMAPGRRALLEAALSRGRPELSDLYRDEAGQIWLDLLVPLRKPSRDGQRPVGVVVLRTLASAFLFPLIQSWPTPSPSAETLLFRRDGDSILFLNELRHRKGSALTLRLPLDSPDQPVALAARTGDKPQTIEGRDYRGVPSLAAVRSVRGTPWFLVAKVDRDEVMRPLHKLVTWVSAVAATAILAVALTLHLLWRQQQRSHRLELLARTGERDRLLNLFYDLPFMGMAIVDPDDDQWLHANDRLCEILGYGHEELLTGTTWTRLIHPDDLEACLAEYRRMLAGETGGYRMEQRFLRKDGSPVDTAVAVRCVRRPDGNPEYVVKTIRDISESKSAEEALRYQLDLTRNITEKATDSIFINDAQGRVTAVNPEAERAFGYSAEELVGQVLHDVIHHHHPDGRPFPMSECPLCHIYMNGEMIRDHEATLIRKDGTLLIATGSNAVLESGGKMVGAALILHDISALKRTELALREREDDLKRAQAVGHIGSWRLDVRRNELTWSEENHRIFGMPAGTPLTYETFLACVHPDDRAYVDRMWQAALRGEPYDIEHRLLVDGKVKWVREKSELEFAPDGHLLGGFGITQDITDIKTAEQAVRDSEERFQLAAEIGRSGTWDWNVRNGEVIWSRGHYDILGYRVGEVAPGYQSWIERVHPEDRAQIEADIRRCMQERGDYVAEFRVVWPDGSVHWMSARGRYEYDGDGACQRMLGVMADITGLKQAELALREADQRKDEFLAMLAHELRNPLAPIRNAAHVLGQLHLDEPRVRWAQDLIERQVTHLAHLVDELLDVSRIARGKVSLNKTHIELADLLRQTCDSVQPLMAAKGHRLEVQMPNTRVMLEGDLVRLVQVLQNLLNNAAKYTPDGGHIELEARRRGQEVEIQVRDNGMGISADLLPGVFDLFRQGDRTLDRSQGGLGIGLTLVRRLVELHGGQVEAYSAGPGLGATFTVHLPATGHAAGVPLPTDDKPSADSTRLRVLVVDDDPAVAESMVVFLELEGHKVRSAASGEAALRLLPEFEPQVVLLDIGLPGQDGYQVARRIRQTPGGDALKLVAVSGYGHEEAMALSRQAGFDRHLVKPVDPDTLVALLAEIGAQW